jgi:hypothetical protein
LREHDFEDFYTAVFDRLVGQLFLVTATSRTPRTPCRRR